ncbi:NAD(P)H-quinone oxidoreductase subunit 2, chloroplastic [Cellulomonas sp. T2.31MG-18]|uniref:proton-conducting transporter transmembrane domain-containing protein n=1 Tax=Cellulomonas sp. T2.31MG-18 TaxID=3157619 RepID=UPI0035EA5DCC
MSGWLLALVVLPTVVGVALLVAAVRRAARADDERSETRAPAVPALALLTAGAVLALSAVVAVRRPRLQWTFLPGGAFALGVSGPAVIVLPAVAAVALLVLAVAAAARTRPAARFHGLMLLFVAAVVVTLTAGTLPTLLLGWELMGAASWALIGFRWRDADRTAAGVVAFLTTRSADLGLYVAVGAAAAGTLSMSPAAGAGLGLGLDGLAALPSPWRTVAAAGLVVAALGKAAQLPFSFWLSRAMLGPSPVSALLHSAAMVAMGGYLLLRVQPLLAATPQVAAVAAWAGALTSVALGLVAMAQRDLKQLLAASTAAQLGFVVLAAGVGDVAGGTAHLVGHAATKALLFLVAGLWLTALGTKRLDALAGAARWWRGVGLLFALAALTLAGLPPLGLWVTKDEVLAAAAASSPWLGVVGLVGAVLSAGYAAVALRAVWRGPAQRPTSRPGWDDEEPGTRHVPAAALPALALLAAGAVLPVALLVPAVRAAVDTMTAPAGPLVGPLGAGLSAGLALVVFGLVLRRVPPPVPGAAAWWHLEQVAGALVVRPVLDAARTADRWDRRLDIVVRGVAHGAVAAAHAAGRFDLTEVAGAVRRLAVGVRSTGRVARGLQTGLVHQYLAAAAALLTAGALVLVVVRP